MPEPRAALAALSLLLATAAHAQSADPVAPEGRWTAQESAAARTPPMGWSSWNAFRTEITEEKVIGSADALVRTGLAKRGYVYVNVDDGWWLRRRPSDNRLEIRTQLFPSATAKKGKDTSFRPFTDRIHGMGLKAGIYTEIGRNACSQAYDLHSPNLPVGSTAEREVGLYGHADQDIGLFLRDWQFDYIKVDACEIADFAPGNPVVAANGYRAMPPLVVRGQIARTNIAAVQGLYRDAADAIRRYNPAAVLSVSLWGQPDVRAWGNRIGNSWRTGEDIVPSWSSMLQSFDTASGRALYAGPARGTIPTCCSSDRASSTNIIWSRRARICRSGRSPARR